MQFSVYYLVLYMLYNIRCSKGVGVCTYYVASGMQTSCIIYCAVRLNCSAIQPVEWSREVSDKQLIVGESIVLCNVVYFFTAV